jgi:hypothetical protein
MAKLLNHHRRILSKNIISKSELKPGMIVLFKYSGKKISDKSPLILFLYDDVSNKLIHGLNLNYLYEHDIQKIFKAISKKVDISISYTDNPNGYPYIQLNKNSKSTIGFGAKQLYEDVIKPEIFSIQRTKDCYRTYNVKNISSLKLVNYKLDVIEDTIREETKISKYKLKTPELFENIKEQQVEVTTDNVRTKTQIDIREDLRE